MKRKMCSIVGISLSIILAIGCPRSLFAVSNFKVPGNSLALDQGVPALDTPLEANGESIEQLGERFLQLARDFPYDESGLPKPISKMLSWAPTVTGVLRDAGAVALYVWCNSHILRISEGIATSMGPTLSEYLVFDDFDEVPRNSLEEGECLLLTPQQLWMISKIVACPVCVIMGTQFTNARDWIKDRMGESVDRFIRHIRAAAEKRVSQENEGKLEVFNSTVKLLLARSSELKTLDTLLRRKIFVQGSLTGQISLMRAVLREDVEEEAKVLSQLPQLDEVCSICLNELDATIPKAVVSRSCNSNHLFHSRCLERWHEIDQTCPICKNGTSPGMKPLHERWQQQDEPVTDLDKIENRD